VQNFAPFVPSLKVLAAHGVQTAIEAAPIPHGLLRYMPGPQAVGQVEHAAIVVADLYVPAVHCLQVRSAVAVHVASTVEPAAHVEAHAAHASFVVVVPNFQVEPGEHALHTRFTEAEHRVVAP
jgi:hypothetical protein